MGGKFVHIEDKINGVGRYFTNVQAAFRAFSGIDVGVSKDHINTLFAKYKKTKAFTEGKPFEYDNRTHSIRVGYLEKE